MVEPCRKNKSLSTQIYLDGGDYFGVVLFIIVVNILLFLLYDVIFYRIGISRNLFINSTFFGTTTGFTFPFVAIYYSLKNAVILYFLILCAFLFLMNSHKYASILAGSSLFIMGNALFNKQAHSGLMAIMPPAESLPAVEPILPVEPVQQQSQIHVEELEEDEERGLLGEYFDPGITLAVSPNLLAEEPSKSVETKMDVPYYIDKAFEYKRQGRNVEALESFMHILKTSKEANTRFLSCIHIAAIYRDMDQKQQAQDILYYFIKDNKNAIDLGLLRQAAALLNS